MKTLAKSLAPFLVAATLIGCGQATEKPLPEFCEGTSCEQTLRPELTGVFVSGHLGNYWDCPEEAYQGDVAIGSSEAPAPGADADFAPCMEGDESCQNVILNCEQASLTVSVSNIGNATATGMQVDRVELFNLDGVKVADLPVIDVTEDNSAFDGKLEAEASSTLRVDFQGPLNPYELLQTGADDAGRSAGSSGTVRVILSSDNADDLSVEGKELYSIPSVDT